MKQLIVVLSLKAARQLTGYFFSKVNGQWKIMNVLWQSIPGKEE